MRTLWVAGGILISTMMATPAQAVSPPPLAEVQADCAQVTVTTSDWPEGSIATLGIGEVNGGPPINTTQTYPVKANEWNHFYAEGLYWSLLIHSPGQADWYTQGMAMCDPPPTNPEIVRSVTTPTPVFEPSVLFPGLELANPW